MIYENVFARTNLDSARSYQHENSKMFNKCSKYFSIFNNVALARWVMYVRRDFLLFIPVIITFIFDVLSENLVTFIRIWLFLNTRKPAFSKMWLLGHVQCRRIVSLQKCLLHSLTLQIFLSRLANRKQCNTFWTPFTQKWGCPKIYFLIWNYLKNMFPTILDMKNVNSVIFRFPVFYSNPLYAPPTWDKVFKSGLNKFFKDSLPQNSLSPLMNNLSQIW